MSLVERVHGGLVVGRRARVLGERLAEMMPAATRVLDVGCGSGLLARQIMSRRPDVQISGVDVLVREQTHIPVEEFDGRVIPYGDAHFDVVMFVDVLHHTEDPMILLREAARVARVAIIIKDHTRDGLFAGATLRFMDWIGNARFNVALPYNYWKEWKWYDAFNTLKLSVDEWDQDLRLYPKPLSWVFDRSLHFVARLGLHDRGSNMSDKL